MHRKMFFFCTSAVRYDRPTMKLVETALTTLKKLAGMATRNRDRKPRKRFGIKFMESTIASLAVLAAVGYCYRDQLPQLRQALTVALAAPTSSCPTAPAGVYYTRRAYSFQTGAGVSNWTPGKELREVALAALTAADTIRVTDGVYTLDVPRAESTQDVLDTTAARDLYAAGLRVQQAQNVAQSAAPSGVAPQGLADFGSNNPLNQPVARVGSYPVYYGTSEVVVYDRYGRAIREPRAAVPSRAIVPAPHVHRAPVTSAPAFVAH